MTTLQQIDPPVFADEVTGRVVLLYDLLQGVLQPPGKTRRTRSRALERTAVWSAASRLARYAVHGATHPLEQTGIAELQEHALLLQRLLTASANNPAGYATIGGEAPDATLVITAARARMALEPTSRGEVYVSLDELLSLANMSREDVMAAFRVGELSWICGRGVLAGDARAWLHTWAGTTGFEEHFERLDRAVARLVRRRFPIRRSGDLVLAAIQSTREFRFETWTSIRMSLRRLIDNNDVVLAKRARECIERPSMFTGIGRKTVKKPTTRTRR